MIGLLILFTLLSMIIVSIFIFLQKDLTQAVILFMGFGLGSVVLFFLFAAPDVALTEAVIGTGISSLVFLIGIKQMDKKDLS